MMIIKLLSLPTWQAKCLWRHLYQKCSLKRSGSAYRCLWSVIVLCMIIWNYNFLLVTLCFLVLVLWRKFMLNVWTHLSYVLCYWKWLIPQLRPEQWCSCSGDHGKMNRLWIWIITEAMVGGRNFPQFSGLCELAALPPGTFLDLDTVGEVSYWDGAQPWASRRSLMCPTSIRLGASKWAWLPPASKSKQQSQGVKTPRGTYLLTEGIMVGEKAVKVSGQSFMACFESAVVSHETCERCGERVLCVRQRGVAGLQRLVVGEQAAQRGREVAVVWR